MFDKLIFRCYLIIEKPYSFFIKLRVDGLPEEHPRFKLQAMQEIFQEVIKKHSK